MSFLGGGELQGPLDVFFFFSIAPEAGLPVVLSDFVFANNMQSHHSSTRRRPNQVSKLGWDTHLQT